MKEKLLTFAVITSMSFASVALVHADNHSAKADKSKHSQMRSDAFAGITLSEEQKLTIASIDESYKPQFEILHEQMNTLKEQHKSLDSSSESYEQQVAGIKAEKERLQSEKTRLKEQHHEEVMSVLTDEQRSQVPAK